MLHRLFQQSHSRLAEGVKPRATFVQSWLVKMPADLKIQCIGKSILVVQAEAEVAPTELSAYDMLPVNASSSSLRQKLG